MSSPFATLPIELVLSILSFAAAHQPTALALSLVTSWVRTHIEPTLYDTVRLTSARSLSAFIFTLACKPRGFAHRTVHKLCITALGPITSIHTVLSECTGVASLASGFSVPSYAYWVRPADDVEPEQPHAGAFGCLPSAPAEQHLLALACRDGLDTAIVSPGVARLRVQLTTAASTTPGSLALLGALHHLTHLALVFHAALVGEGSFAGAVGDTLERVVRGGRIRVLVLQVAGGATEACLEDIRGWGRRLVERRVSSEGSSELVVSVSCAPRSFLSDWEEGDAFWQRTEGSGESAVT